MRTPAALAALSLFCAASAAHADDELPSLSIYGFLRVDAIGVDSRVDDTAAPRAVLAESDDTRGNGALAMHARLSRIGLTVDRWDVSDDTAGEGQVEIDFFGPDAVRLRHAWAALHPTKGVEILLGQTWDLASPLYPLASPATLLWDAGNTGGFRPQARVTVLPSDRVRMAVAIAGTGDPDGVHARDVDDDGRADGEESGLPMAQWLFELRGRVGEGPGEPARLGVWGHVGRDDLASRVHVPSWSVGGHVYLPFRRFSLLGEITHGKNTAALGGGLGRGIDLARERPIRATGGWVEATLVSGKKFLVAEGVSFDAADEADLAAGDRQRTIVGYLALRMRPHATVEVGLEGSYWSTRYKPASADEEAPVGQALRANLHAGVLF